MIKRISKFSSLLLVVIFMLLGVLFLFTQPTQAPSMDLISNSSELKNPTENTYIKIESDSKIGEGVIADSYLIYDENSKKTIVSKNPHTPVAIASLTKLMTAYVVVTQGSLTDEWAIASSHLTDIRPILGLASGDRVLIKDLVDATLVGSANDAAKALGAYLTSIKQQTAVEIMNQTAKSLGMESTHYENTIGFDSEQNYSTAEDLKLLVEKVRENAMFSDLDRKQSYSFTSQTGKQYYIKATNSLLATDPEIHAIKTGFTDEAKGAMITAINHENKKFVIIVLGSENRESDTKLLKQQVIAAIK